MKAQLKNKYQAAVSVLKPNKPLSDVRELKLRESDRAIVVIKELDRQNF